MIETNKVANRGYKNPLCLTRAKQVQPALYNGHVLVMSNHARPVVHDSEDTREISEITRKRMLEKMKSPLYENDRKKAETSVPKPLSALTVYPPNTPVKLVPRVLPTKSQVKINLYVLTQLFTEFDKTCKKRITPTGVTEGERGFEQTKRCYLTEVIPFFKTLKEHFARVQTALFKEVKIDDLMALISRRQFELRSKFCQNKKFLLLLTDRTPTQIGDPKFQTLQIRLFSNAGGTDHPLVSGLRLFKTRFRGMNGSCTALENLSSAQSTSGFVSLVNTNQVISTTGSSQKRSRITLLDNIIW
ncbi:hypothetical protein Tco_0008256 [Tanacetum coccineum]